MSTPPPIPPDPQDPRNIPPVPPAPPLPPAPPASHGYPSGPAALPPQPTPGKSTKILLFGCLGVLVVVGVGIAMVAMWVTTKAKEAVRNPVRFAAEMMVSADPNLEVASSDDASKTVTIRNLTTGKETTFNMDDLQNGKLSFHDSDGQRAELGPDGIRVTDQDGAETVIGGGEGAAVELPGWVPVYPGGHTVVLSSKRTSGNRTEGIYTFSTSDAVTAAPTTWQTQMEAAGFTCEVQETTAGNGRVTTITGSAPAPAPDGGTYQIDAGFAPQDKGTLIHLTYSWEKAAPTLE